MNARIILLICGLATMSLALPTANAQGVDDLVQEVGTCHSWVSDYVYYLLNVANRLGDTVHGIKCMAQPVCPVSSYEYPWVDCYVTGRLPLVTCGLHVATATSGNVGCNAVGVSDWAAWNWWSSQHGRVCTLMVGGTVLGAQCV